MSQSGITPNRHTRVTFDIAETVTVSPFQGFRRRGGEIAQGRADGVVDPDKHSAVRLLSVGAWILKPIQTEITNIQEKSSGNPFLLLPSLAAAAENFILGRNSVVENQTRANTDLPGMIVSDQVNASGGPFVVKKVPAPSSDNPDPWNAPVPSGMPNLLAGDDTGGDFPLDREGEGLVNYAPDQGFFLNWSLPGSEITYLGVYLAFYFAQFAIGFTGSGMALLYEYVQFNVPAGDGSAVYDWVQRGEWRYARAGQISGTAHSLGIIPLLGPNKERFIVFTNNQVDFAQVSSSYAQTTATSVTPGDYQYTAQPNPRYVDFSRGHVTSEGTIRWDVRRDIKVKFQPSLLGFPTSGLLVDDTACFPPDATSLNAALFPARIFADIVTPPGTGIVSSLVDGLSGAVYDPSIHTRPQAKFVFSGDGSKTPVLWGYSVNRDSASNISAPGEFTGGNLRSVNVVGYSGDPTQQSASVVIQDVRGELQKLLTRGQLSVRIGVVHDEGGQTFVTPIFRGYAIRPVAKKKGKPDRAYPSPSWYEYTIPMMGMWTRLAEPTSGPLLASLFYNDPSVSPEQRQGYSFFPWKVTDAIAYLLQCAGFSSEQIRIPDYPIRLWQGYSDKVDVFAINPNTEYAEMALRLCRNFLGAYLLYDETVDAWTIIGGTPLDAPPIYHFLTADAGQGRISTAPGAYGPLTSLMFGEFSPSPVAAEYNLIHVVCPFISGNAKTPTVIERWLYNFDSFAVPGATNTLSSSHPDYIGHVRPCEVVDVSLYVSAGDNSEQFTQQAVDWTAQRLYDFCCHGQILAHFSAPLVFIQDASTGQWRMLRFGDPVTVNGLPFIIKACVPNYTNDNQQKAVYEVIQPVAGQHIPPGIDAMAFFRKGTDRRGGKASGSYTDSHRLASISVPAHAEHRFRDLPRSTTFQLPMQDSNGFFFYPAGYTGAGL